MHSFKIGNKEIGYKKPVFIIAEAGVNHNGNIELAKELVVKAKESGADCVKFQTFKAEDVVTKNAPKAKYQLKTTDPEESQINMLKSLQLPLDSYKDLIEFCNNEKIIFLSTPYNINDVDFLDKIGAPAFKLASMHTIEPYMIEYTASKQKPVILSTGMATLSEVDEAVSAFKRINFQDFALLQCTTNYPASIEDANLRVIDSLKQTFNTTVGYSDHTQDDIACIASVALGAKIIEKHFTLDKSMEGPDQSSSCDPEEFSKLVKNIRKVEKSLGSYYKKPSKIELQNLIGMRRSIVSDVKIPSGSIITKDMVSFKRPSGGLMPKYINDVIGMKTRRDIPEDTQIMWKDLE